MKKFLLFVMFATLFANAYAQKAKFESNIKLRYDTGVSEVKNNDCSFEYIAGIRTSEQFKIGLGLGLSTANMHYNEMGLRYYQDVTNSEFHVPVFLNVKVNLNKDKIAPFLNFNVGYVINPLESTPTSAETMSVFFNPSFGVNFPYHRGNITAELGYKYQMRKIEEGNILYKGGECNYSQVEIAVGYEL